MLVPLITFLVIVLHLNSKKKKKIVGETEANGRKNIEIICFISLFNHFKMLMDRIGNTEYFLPTIEAKGCNVMIDGQNLYR